MAIQPQTPQKPERLLFAALAQWIVVLGFLAWSILIFWPESRAEVTIPYTTFLAQVRANNVQRVRVVGNEITGPFAKPFQWPQPKADGSPPAGTTSNPSPAAKKGSAQPDSKAGTTYTGYVTHFPQTIGDPTLLPLLEAHGVVMEVGEPSNHWLMTLLLISLPSFLLLGFLFWTGRQGLTVVPCEVVAMASERSHYCTSCAVIISWK